MATRTCLATILLLLCAHGAHAADALPSITVTGRGEVRVAPDEAVLRMAVETLDSELDVAKSTHDRIVRVALDRIRDLDVPDDRISADRLQIAPVSTGRQSAKINAYRVTTSIMVTVRDLDRVDDIVTSALEAGVNRIDDLTYRRSDFRARRDEALRMALTAAREKAELMAEAMGVGIGAPLTIQESVRRVQPSFSNTSVTIGTADPSEDGPLAPGMLSIPASVTVTFALSGA